MTSIMKSKIRSLQTMQCEDRNALTQAYRDSYEKKGEEKKQALYETRRIETRMHYRDKEIIYCLKELELIEKGIEAEKQLPSWYKSYNPETAISHIKVQISA